MALSHLKVFKSFLPTALLITRPVKLDVDKVRKSLRHGEYDVNGRDSEGWALLHYACWAGQLDVMRVLLSEFNADVDIQGATVSRPTALMIAAVRGHAGIVRVLLSEYQCPVSTTDGWDRTASHYACSAEHASLEVVSCLIEDFGCDPNARDCASQTLLHVACQGVGNVGVVKYLILKHKADVNARDDYNHTPLEFAAYFHNAEVMLCLIDEFGCDPIDVIGYDGKTSLHFACEAGNVSLVKCLIDKHGADVNACDDRKEIPLQVAACQNKAEVVTCLIEDFGCDPNIRGSNGKTLLHLVCEVGNVNLVKYLIDKHEADVNAHDDKNQTPLQVAAYQNRAEVMICLIDNFGCDPNIRDEEGNSLLHLACCKGLVSVCAMLVSICSLYAVNNDGNTPLHVAARKNELKCVEMLLAANAPILARNKNGETPANIASFGVRNLLKQYMQDHGKRIQVEYEAMLVHAKEVYSGEHHIIRLYVVGNPGAGKSSLVESLRREGFFKSFQRVSESSVPPHTAGIIPTEYYSKRFGRILLYDFAGDVEYYSSHAAILENVASCSRGDDIFLVVVNLMDSVDSIERTLEYWVAFIQQQKFASKSLSLGIVGSHYDLAIKKVVSEKIEGFKPILNNNGKDFLLLGNGYYLIDCCKPRSSGINDLKRQIFLQTKCSRKYSLSDEACKLIGLLKKDFGEVVACSVQTVLSHIADSKVQMSHHITALQPLLFELHEIGIILMLGDKSKEDSLLIMDTSKLTNIVHELLFSPQALIKINKITGSSSLNIGVISESDLDIILPPYIRKECLVQLQYCREIKGTHIKVFPPLEQVASKLPNQSYYFFPAMCNSDKSDTLWDTDPEFNCDVGWLARCTDICDYFPPRFLHVLLLRLVFRFTLSVSDSPAPESPATVACPESPAPVACPESPSFKLHCTMWKTGVQWSMEEGVKCRVEMLNDNKGVVVLAKSIEDNTDNFTSIFNDIIHCVMEAKAEFCHRIRPKFFLLDSTSEADYLSDDNLYPMSDVNRVLKDPRGKKMVYSVSRKGYMGISKLSYIRKQTCWEYLFPMKLEPVLIHFNSVHISNLLLFGLRLGLAQGDILAIEENFPFDANRRMTEVLKVWVSSSSLGFPCWWHLVEALEDVERHTLAKEIASAHGM